MIPDASTRVCPRCGEAAGETRYCGTCGLNILDESEIPTREAWETTQATAPDPAGSQEVRVCRACASQMARSGPCPSCGYLYGELKGRTCPRCGERQGIDGAYCSRCGERLPTVTATTSLAAQVPPATVPVWPTPPVVVAPAPTPSRPEQKSTGLALFLNFLWPGAGHLYGGVRTDFGIVFCCISGVMFLLGLTIIGLVISIPAWAVMAPWSMVDVNRRVKERNRAFGYASAEDWETRQQRSPASVASAPEGPERPVR